MAGIQYNNQRTIDGTGKFLVSTPSDTGSYVTENQLKEWIKDVYFYASRSAFPNAGEDGILYIDKEQNRIYRWNGTSYVEITVDISGKADKTYVDTQLALKYAKPNTGIPKTDLASDVQTSLGKADTAIQDISGKADTSTVNTLRADITGKLGVYNFTEVDDNATVILDGDSEQNLAQMVQATSAYEQDAIMLSLEPIIPTSSTHNFGIKGQIAIDSDYLYVCVAENVWKKITLQNL